MTHCAIDPFLALVAAKEAHQISHVYIRLLRPNIYVTCDVTNSRDKGELRGLALMRAPP